MLFLAFTLLLLVLGFGQFLFQHFLPYSLFVSESKSIEIISLVVLVLEIVVLRQLGINLHRTRPDIGLLHLSFYGGLALSLSSFLLYSIQFFLGLAMPHFLYDTLPFALYLLIFKFGFGFLLMLIVAFKLKGKSRGLPILLMILYWGMVFSFLLTWA